MIAITVMLLLVSLIVLGMPIAFALAVTGTIGMYVTVGFEPMLGVLKTTPYRTSASFLLSTVPLFILMAELLARGSIVRNLYRACYVWMGHVRGGLALAAIAANVGFAVLSGSSTAAAAAMSRISIPEMRRYGYDESFALGVVAIGGTLSILIPPSLPLILYGVMTETSIGKLFLAGILPGVLTVAVYMLVILIQVRRRPEIAPATERHDWSERIGALPSTWPVLMLMVLVLGGIYSGAITATEAAAVGATGALLISIAFGGLRGQGLKEAFSSTLRTTSMIFSIIIGAMIFGYFLAITQMPQALVDWVGGLPLPPGAILAIIVLIYLVLGFFIDQIAIIVLTLPLIFPLVQSLGYDPIWFGIIVTKTAELGLVTPPLGMNVFVACGVSGARVEDGFRGITPLLIGDALVLLVLILLPGIVTYLPNQMF
ncbi:TRAP transporter large permease [Seohaeicola zhoushanensis]|uniref:TRAP transporter large permease protein n=1 Tax=Seohaeicola zhoushanensis TaxID=1569283 RepID=A0A8J3GVR7_9RHOB|nr:TRAP transporter large permease [Seohaeicola zhoushanensis]GHF45246.1 C4-dicarboxylate ABC transporter permease [Seohaeicola zhoushanensis]